ATATTRTAAAAIRIHRRRRLEMGALPGAGVGGGAPWGGHCVGGGRGGGSGGPVAPPFARYGIETVGAAVFVGVCGTGAVGCAETSDNVAPEATATSAAWASSPAVAYRPSGL